MKKVLIKLSSKEQANKVFAKLESLKEKTDRSYFDHDDDYWNCIGFYLHLNEWTIAKKDHCFVFDTIISAEEFLNQEVQYEIY